MTSNTDSTLFIYLTQHIRVKVYKDENFQPACGNAQSDAFLAGAIQGAARSGRLAVEEGTRAATLAAI
jgi:hypothetical protein